MNNKICITGSSGWLGGTLLKHYQNNQLLFDENDGEWFKTISNPSEIVTFDIADGQDLSDTNRLEKAFEGVDTVVHIAAIPSPRDFDFTLYFKINVQGTLNVAEAAKKQGVKRIVYASSTAYYGLDANLPIEVPIKEDNKVVTQLTSELPLDTKMDLHKNSMSYGTSKVMAELVLANYGMTGILDVIMLRIAPVNMPTPLRGIAHVSLKKVIQSFDIAIAKENIPSYSAYTIANETDGVDMTKANEFFKFNNLK